MAPGDSVPTAAASRTLDGSTVCIYCASSESCDPEFHAVAHRLGALLAAVGARIVYGGGRVGSMGALAQGALAAGGHVTGIIPRFMQELEWGHGGLTELKIVEDMRVRKHEMLTRASAVVALAGGCGTLEELFEAITLKRLGLYLGPIVIVNTRGYYDPLVRLLEDSVRERFMDERHLDMWQVVATAEQVPAAIASAVPWDSGHRHFAVR